MAARKGRDKRALENHPESLVFRPNVRAHGGLTHLADRRLGSSR